MFKEITTKELNQDTDSHNSYQQLINYFIALFNLANIPSIIILILLIESKFSVLLNVTSNLFPVLRKSEPVPAIYYYEHNYTSLTRIIVTHNIKDLDYVYTTNCIPKEHHHIPDDIKINSQVSVTHFKNSYFGMFPIFNNIGIRSCHMTHDKTELQQTVSEADIAVAYYQFFYMYGHNFHDFFASLMYLPDDVLKREFVVLPPPLFASRMQELFNILGLKAKILINYKKGQQIFVRDLYMVSPRDYVHAYTMGGLPRAKKLIDLRLNIKKIDATEFAVINRNPDNNKKWKNTDALLEALIKNVPVDEGCSWKIYVEKCGAMIDTIKLWRSIKVLVSPQGSMIYNAMFMAPKTGMCLSFCCRRDDANIQLAICTQIFMVAVYHLDVAWEQDYDVNISLMCKYTQYVVDCVKNERWMNTEGLIKPWDSNLLGVNNKPYYEVKDYQKPYYKEEIINL